MHNLSKRNITLTSILVLSLAISILPANVQAPGGTVNAFVDPATTGALPVGGTFDIIVQLTNVKGLAAYTGKLTYDTLVLTATAADAEYTSPSGGICGAGGCEDITPEAITDSLGEVTWEVALTGFPTGFTGSGGMVKISFRVDAGGTTPLDITPEDGPLPSEGFTTLIDIGFNEIPHSRTDGSYGAVVKTAPTAVLTPAGPLKVMVGEQVAFDGSGSFDTNSPPQPLIRYEFSVDGTTVQSGTMTTFIFSSSQTGPHTVCLVVVNESGMSSSPDCTDVLVNPMPLSVDFTATPSLIFKTEPVTFTAQVMGGTEPYSYRWDVFADGVVDGTNPTLTFTFPSKGPRSVQLTVTDAAGTSIPVTKTFTVWNEPKFAALKWSIDSDGDGVVDSFFAKFKVLAPFSPALTTDIQIHIQVTDLTTMMPAGCLDAFYNDVPQRTAVIVAISPSNPAHACQSGATFTPVPGVEYSFVGTLIYTTLDATGTSDFVRTGSLVA